MQPLQQHGGVEQGEFLTFPSMVVRQANVQCCVQSKHGQRFVYCVSTYCINHELHILVHCVAEYTGCIM